MAYMKTTVAAVMISAMLGAFAVEGPCKDESCSLPVQGEATYSVMSPVPDVLCVWRCIGTDTFSLSFFMSEYAL